MKISSTLCESFLLNDNNDERSGCFHLCKLVSCACIGKRSLHLIVVVVDDALLFSLRQEEEKATN